MRGICSLTISDIMPNPREVLRSQGIPDGACVQAAVEEILAESLEILRFQAKPVGALAGLSREEFEFVFEGHEPKGSHYSP